MTTTANPRVFFGWYLVAFTFVMQFLAMGTGFYVFGVLLVPLTETLQADRFLVSLALSLQTLSSALLSQIPTSASPRAVKRQAGLRARPGVGEGAAVAFGGTSGAGVASAFAEADGCGRTFARFVLRFLRPDMIQS